MPPKRDEAALQEEEELQLAIALSQSEAEEKERMVSYTAEIFHHTFDLTTLPYLLPIDRKTFHVPHCHWKVSSNWF